MDDFEGCQLLVELELTFRLLSSLHSDN